MRFVLGDVDTLDVFDVVLLLLLMVEEMDFELAAIFMCAWACGEKERILDRVDGSELLVRSDWARFDSASNDATVEVTGS